MKLNYKKAAAAAAAIVMAASLCGCADSGYIMTVDGIQIRNGVYLSGELTAINSASTSITEERTEYGDTSEVADIFKETVDGVDAVEWIKTETLNNVKRLIAIQRLCEQYGITLTDEQQTSVDEEINSLWNDENYYAYYIYGVYTMGEYYESVGISKDSLKEIYTIEDLGTQLFLHYYDTDGLTPVSDEEFNDYIKENYAIVKAIKLEYTDYQGLTLKTDEEIQEVKELAQSYVDRINSGEDITEIKYEVDLKTAQDKAHLDAEEAYAELEDEELPDYDEYIQEAIDAVTVDKLESADDLDTVISLASSSFDEDVTEYIWNAADDGKATLYENDTASYIIVREDVTGKEEWKDTIRTTVLNALKSEEFEDILKETYADYVVEANDYLVNTKYAPDKIKGYN